MKEVLLLLQEKREPSKRYRRASGRLTLARLFRAQLGRFHLRWSPSSGRRRFPSGDRLPAPSSFRRDYRPMPAHPRTPQRTARSEPEGSLARSNSTARAIKSLDSSRARSGSHSALGRTRTCDTAVRPPAASSRPRLEVRPTSRLSARDAVGRTSVDRLDLGTRQGGFEADWGFSAAFLGRLPGRVPRSTYRLSPRQLVPAEGLEPPANDLEGRCSVL